MPMNRSLSPQHYGEQIQSIRNLDVTRISANNMIDNRLKKSMFASGERGNRYTMDPEQEDDQPKELIHLSIRRMNSDGPEPERNKQRRQVMQQQRMHQSMHIPMQKNSNGSGPREGSVNFRQTASRHQLMQLQKMYHSMSPANFRSDVDTANQRQKMMLQKQMIRSMSRGSFGSERNGSQSSRRQMMQQQRMHQPTSPDNLRSDVDTPNPRQQMMLQKQMNRSMSRGSFGSERNGSQSSRRQMMQQQKAHQSMSPDNLRSDVDTPNQRQQTMRLQQMNRSMSRRSFGSERNESQSSRRQTVQQEKMHQSKQIPRNKDLMRLRDREINEQQQFSMSKGLIRSKSEGGISRGALSDEAVAGSEAPTPLKNSKQHVPPQVGMSCRKSFDSQSEGAKPQMQRNKLTKSMVISGNKSAANLEERRSFQEHRREELTSTISKHYQPVGQNSFNNANSMPNRNGLNGSLRRTSDRRSTWSHNQMIANQFPHAIVLPTQRRSWGRDEENNERASMDNVLMQSEHSELRRGVGQLACVSSRMEGGLIPDDEDLSDDDFFGGVTQSQDIQKSLTSQAEKSRGSATCRSSLASRDRADDDERTTSERFRNIRSNMQKRNSAGWKTLSEDNSHLNCRRALIGLVIGVIMLGGVITAVVCLAPFDTDTYANLGDESAPAERDVMLPIPIRDISGRCSPSNIHGSMAACVEACSMAACCYARFSGESCENVEVCSQYRPYCDVIFAPWSDALAGGVAPPPADLFGRTQWDEVCLGSASSASINIPYKQRHHVTDMVGTSRFLEVVKITPHICEQACLPGSCCIAPRASEAGAELYMTTDGVAKNVTTGDHVEINCINDKNFQSCAQYNDKCSLVMQSWGGKYVDIDSIVDTINPTMAITATTPITSMATDLVSSSPSPSITPPDTSEGGLVADKPQSDGNANIPEQSRPQSESTSKPTDKRTSKPTTQPTNTAPSISLPNINKIKTACTGIQTVLEIVDGVLNTVTKCQKVCEPGSCCFSDASTSCFDANREVCMAYSDCLVLSMTSEDVSLLEAAKEATPKPTTDLYQFCSTSATAAGVFECVKHCQPASCCGAIEEELSCFRDNEDTCVFYGPCLELVDANGGDAKSIPPTPPADLSHTCSYSNVMVDSDECVRACSAGMCCLDYSCPPFEDEQALTERCELYQPCNNLLQLSMPSDELQVLCDGKSQLYSEQSCNEACSVSSCCFVDDQDPCWANFEDACKAYAPYCAPDFIESDVTIIQVQEADPNLAELCVGAQPSPACQKACSIGACCFLASEDNCWPENEDTCGAYYAVCAFLYQDFQESEDRFT